MMKSRTKKQLKIDAEGYLLILPLLISLIVFTFYPLVLSFINSLFYGYDGFSSYSDFTFGLGNYKKAFVGYESEVFWKSIGVTFGYALVMVPLGMILSFLFAVLLNRPKKFTGVFRMIYYLPCLIPGIVQTMIYRYMFSDQPYGLMNSILLSMGLPQQSFFESEGIESLVTFGLMSLFGTCGSIFIWSAGLKSIPKDCYEAAKLDGSSSIRTFFSITIPLMGPYVMYNLVTNLIGTLQICDSAYMISSSGGKNNNLLFFGLYIYKTFLNNDFGYASALSYILFVFIALLTILVFKFQKNVYYAGD